MGFFPVISKHSLLLFPLKLSLMRSVERNAVSGWHAEMQSNFFHHVDSQCLFRLALGQRSSGNRTAMNGFTTASAPKMKKLGFCNGQKN